MFFVASFRYAEIQDKSSDISIPLNEPSADTIDPNGSNKENEVKDPDEDDESEVEEDLDAEEAELSTIEPHIEIVISDDEELS